MFHLKTVFCLLLCIVGCFLQAHGADKYTDENRPYEFGFTIDGEQHRHEKKDKNGIIMGEFGFITADGVYHVTVYATDENGRFKILSMKNIRVKPYPTSPGIDVRNTSPTKQSPSSKEITLPNVSARQGHSIEYPKSQQNPSKQSVSEKQKLNQQNNVGPAKSCSHCSLPTTTTPAPKFSSPASANSQFEQNSYDQLQVSNGPGQQNSGFELNNLQPPIVRKNNQQSLDEEPNYPKVSSVGDNYQQNPGARLNSQQATGTGINYQQSSMVLSNPEVSSPGNNYQQNSGMGQTNPQAPNIGGNYQQNSGVGQSNSQAPNIGGNYQQSSGVGLNNQEISNVGGSYQQNSGMGQTNPQAPSIGGNYQKNSGVGQSNSQAPNIGGNYQQRSGVGLNNPEISNVGDSYQQNSGMGQTNPQAPSIGGNYQKNSGVGQSNSQAPNIGGNYQQSSTVGLNNPQEPILNEYQPESDVSKQTPNTVEQSSLQQGVSRNSVSGYRNPKSFNDILQSAIPDQQYNSVGTSSLESPQSSEKPVLIAAQMQIVDKNTNIYHKNPGENDGLPKGLSKNDMSHLLYTFNYTVGFHGHHEEGYSNGAKQGYYYVTGRNGIRTRVDYVADEKGFHPRISQEILDVASDDVPKPETEKDEKYGLKGYEFKWLYYPVDSKKR